MPITKKDINRALEGGMEEDAKQSFLDMSREDQMIVILSMEGSNSNRLAIVEKRQIEFEQDIKTYRRQREIREDNGSEETMNTTQKILAAIAEAEAKKFNWSAWFRDRVLPSFVTVAISAFIVVLGLFLSGKLP
jgi:Trk K+ transport system NAD-binding subunit